MCVCVFTYAMCFINVIIYFNIEGLVFLFNISSIIPQTIYIYDKTGISNRNRCLPYHFHSYDSLSVVGQNVAVNPLNSCYENISAQTPNHCGIQEINHEQMNSECMNGQTMSYQEQRHGNFHRGVKTPRSEDQITVWTHGGKWPFSQQIIKWVNVLN